MVKEAGQEITNALVRPQVAMDLDPRPDFVRVELVARALEEGHDGLLYAYNGLNPGPVIRAKVGDELTVNFRNELDAPTTIHWHGIKVPFDMDGVTWRGAPIEPGETFQYQFTLSHAGTFWYHPHFNTDRQVDGGLYGALIVENPDEPTTDDERLLIFDTAHEFDEARSTLPDGLMGRTGHGHGRRKALWLINGEPAPVKIKYPGGSTVRVRMINVSSSGYVDLSWPDIRQIAADQGLFPSMQHPENIVLGPGDRAEVEWQISRDDFDVDNAAWSLNGGSSYEPAETLLEVEVENPADRAADINWPFTGQAVSADPGYMDILYALSGSDRTGIWLINGERFPDVTISQVEYGAEVIIEVRNLSPTEHPFHLHGLQFEVLSKNGRPSPYQMIEDTFNLRIRDQVRLKVLADNPGFWMTHCHILPHAGDGMMTVLQVNDP
jgi:FtsP/CotA-like multicopper oxidase with cupredoxin domain